MNSHAEATLQDPQLAGGSGVTSPLSADGSESNMAVAVASARRLARGDEQGRRPGSGGRRGRRRARDGLGIRAQRASGWTAAEYRGVSEAGLANPAGQRAAAPRKGGRSIDDSWWRVEDEHLSRDVRVDGLPLMEASG